MPTLGQFILTLIACLFFAAGGGISVLQKSTDDRCQRLLAKTCVYWGISLALAALIWHASNCGEWMPLGDNFESLLWLGLLLAGFMLYIQRTRPLRGLDWFLLPVIIVLLLGADLFGRWDPHSYSPATWDWFHRTSSYLGAVAFAVAGAGGAMYLIAQRRLRAKPAMPAPNIGSLERLERLTFASVTLGFALLTIGLVTGLVAVLHDRRTILGPNWLTSPKVLLSGAVWIVYAIILHSPINPRFRGRTTAMLSILGFVLMIGTLIAVQFVPGGNR